eukprot:3907159-Alexandrium_andersonii.AAC.1
MDQKGRGRGRTYGPEPPPKASPFAASAAADEEMQEHLSAAPKKQARAKQEQGEPSAATDEDAMRDGGSDQGKH